MSLHACCSVPLTHPTTLTSITCTFALSTLPVTSLSHLHSQHPHFQPSTPSLPTLHTLTSNTLTPNPSHPHSQPITPSLSTLHTLIPHLDSFPVELCCPCGPGSLDNGEIRGEGRLVGWGGERTREEGREEVSGLGRRRGREGLGG